MLLFFRITLIPTDSFPFQMVHPQRSGTDSRLIRATDTTARARPSHRSRNDRGRRCVQVFRLECRRWSQCRFAANGVDADPRWDIAKRAKCSHGWNGRVPLFGHGQRDDGRTAAHHLVQGWPPAAQFGQGGRHAASDRCHQGGQGHVPVRRSAAGGRLVPGVRRTAAWWWVVFEEFQNVHKKFKLSVVLMSNNISSFPVILVM